MSYNIIKDRKDRVPQTTINYYPSSRTLHSRIKKCSLLLTNRTEQRVDGSLRFYHIVGSGTVSVFKSWSQLRQILKNYKIS